MGDGHRRSFGTTKNAKETTAMAALESVNAAGVVREHLESASPDVLRAMVKTFAEALMSAEADAVCGATYGERSEDRTNQRNGYRAREWDTRAGTIELAVPKLRTGSYFPDWLLQAPPPAQQGVVVVGGPPDFVGGAGGRGGG